MAYRLRVRNAAQLVTICSGGQRFKVGKDQDEVHFPNLNGTKSVAILVGKQAHTTFDFVFRWK